MKISYLSDHVMKTHSVLETLGFTPETASKLIADQRTYGTLMSEKHWDNCSPEEVVRLCRLVANSKITSRFLERWIANQVNGISGPKNIINENLKNDGKDYGDLMFGASREDTIESINSKIGKDNAELKSVEVSGRNVIGGGQHRFYENIPYYLYLIFQQDGDDTFDLYLLSKQEIHDELFIHKVARPTISQGSGKTKKKTEKGTESMDNDEVLKLVQESFDGKNQLLWGFDIKSNVGEFIANEPKKPKPTAKAFLKYSENLEAYLLRKAEHDKKKETLDRWNSKYKVTIEQLKNWEQLKQDRYGI